MVRRARDQAVKGVDLADQMALAEAADAPIRAAAAAASVPAWPPPTTMMS